MQLCSIAHIQYPAITADDVKKLAAVLDLTSDTGAPVITSGGSGGAVASGGDAALLTDLYRRSLDAIERHTGRIMRESKLQITLLAENESTLTLPVFPVASVDKVYVGGAETADYTVSASAAGTRLTFPAPVSGNVVVDVTAGYAAPILPPPCFEAAVLALAADMYEHRESQSEVNLYENRQLKFVLADLNFYHCG